MANRNNTGRTKKSYSYRPYDTSNSFVKRFTAKVSEILPQPTSWVSRFFSTSPKLNVREREELDEEEEDEEERQPPNKRLCFSSSETNDYSHQNNINRLSDIDRDSGEISPIAISRIASDEPIPGPSGLHLRHFPISSTPAIRAPALSPAPDLVEKGGAEQERVSQQQRDDASDESESTSGCSSLVPGTHPRQDPPPTPSATLQPSLPSSTLGSARRLSISTAQKTNTSISRNSLNLSSSSQPAFDPYVFINPLNKSGIRKRLLGEESCFYSGNTTFGGSSARSPVTETPRVVTVRASPVPQPQQDTIGASALKILRALEQFSTPVLDAKRIPMRKGARSAGRQPQPYEELIVPSMPDLLRVKRREQEIRAAEKAAAAASSLSSSSATSTPSQPHYTIGVENQTEKHVGSIKGRNKDIDFESERIPPISLPTDVKLQLSSLPKLDLECTGKAEQSSQQAKPSFAKNLLKFKFSEPLEPFSISKKSDSTATPNAIVTKSLPPQHQMKNPSPNFKLKRKTGTTSPATPKSPKLPIITNTVTLTNDFWGSMNANKPLNNDLGCTSCTIAQKCSTCAKSQVAKKESDVKSADPSWECLKCSLKNISADQKCKSCGLKRGEKPNTLKGFEGYLKPKDTWDCKECFVTNKNSVDVCPACSTPKSGKPPSNNKSFPTSFSKSPNVKLNDASVTSTSSSNSLSMLAKAPSGSWECDTCLVKNKKDDLKCVACSTVKPGAKLPEEPKPTFSFGIPSTSSSTKSFSIPSAESKPAQPTFTFGIPNNTSVSTSNSVFSFGDQKKSDDIKVSTVTDTVSSTQTQSTIVNSFKKTEGSWECNTCLVVNKKDATSCVACSTVKPGASVDKPKPSFTFGIPATTSSTPLNLLNASVPSSTATTTVPVFTFGNPSEKDASKSTSTFNFLATNDSSKSASEIKPFSFINSDQPKENDTVKNSLSSNTFNFGNTNCEVMKSSETNEDQDDKPPKKKVSFGIPLISEKNATSEKSEAVTFGNLVPCKPPENNTPSNFTFKPFENNAKLSAPSSNSFFPFGTASDTSKTVTSQLTAKPLTFGSSSESTTTQAATPSTFGSSLDSFKPPESENKPFTFMANATPSSTGYPFNSTSQTSDLGSQQTQPKSNSLSFGQQQLASPSTTTLFSQPQDPKPFAFSAPAQQQPFTLPPVPSQPASSSIGGNTSSGGFNFSIPSNAPKFDPNIKPAFNFTGGATPSFNAAPSSVVAERKMKRGIRRVTANR